MDRQHVSMTAPNTIAAPHPEATYPCSRPASLLALAPDFGRKWQFTVAVNTLTRGGRVAFGWDRGGRLLRGGLAMLARAIRLDFLGAWPFRREIPRLRLLDFLGFSRPNRDISMSYADKGVEIFSRRFSLA
jgi:hypothetical protein